MQRSIIYIITLIFFSSGIIFAQDPADDISTYPSGEVLAGSCEEFYDVPQVYIEPEIGSWRKITRWCNKNNVFNGLDAGISVGSAGIGLSLTTPVTKWVNLRTGIDWLPKFRVPLDFNLNTYADGMPTGNFNHVAQMLYDNTGIVMDETVHMYGEGRMLNFKLMFDIFPVPSNRHWHVTAGFYLGTAKIGRAYNDYSEKPTLVALNIYNRGYKYFTNITDVFNVPLGGGTYMDPDLVRKLQAKFRDYGQLGINIGEFSHDIYDKNGDLIFEKGDKYIMDPAPDGSVTAKAVVNHFKPYIGAGYATDLDRDGKWHFNVELGALFWGGAPNILNYDYNDDIQINFTKDLKNLRGKVGDYMKAIKSFPVYPVLEIRFSYSFL